jgi:YVTN family beta-propeller protein
LVGGETFNPFAHAANPDTSKSVMIYVALVPDDSCGSPPCPPIPRLFLAVEGGYLVAWDPLVNQIAQSMFMGGEINSLDVDSSGALIAVTVGTHVILIETDFLTGVRLRLDDSYEQALNPCTPIFSPADRFRIGNILTLPDDGAGDPDTSLAVDAMHSAVGERVFCSATGTILERFYDTSPDIYDFVMVFFSSDWRGMLDPVEGNPINIEPEAGNAFHHLVRNYTRGIGREFELGYRFGNSAANLNLNTKRLQSVVHLNDLAEFDSYAGFRGRSAISVFAQELGHRFAAFADFESTPVLKDDAAHWNSVFNSEGSVMGGTGGNWIVDNLDGTFIIAGKECTLSEWDEYLMGFRSPAEIGAGGSSFYVDDAVPLSPAWTIPPYRTDDVILGTRVDVSLSDLINQHGARIPDSRFAQKVFHVGVCVVTPGGNASQLDLDEVQDLIAALGQFWEDETEGRSNLTFQNHPTIYSTPETSLGVGSLPGRSAVADFNPSSCAVSIFAKLYVPNQGDDTVSVIDIDPNSTTFHDEIATLDVGHQPTAVAVSRDLCRAYVTSRIDGEVTVIDTAIDAVVGSEKITGVGVGSSSIAVDDNLQRAYVLNSLDETIATLDLGTRMFDSSFATGAQLLPDSELLAVSTNQKVAVLNPTTGNLIRRIPLEARSSPPGRGRRATHLTEPAHSALAVRPSTNGVYLWDDSRRLRQIDPESGSTLTLGQDVRDLEAMSFAFAEEALIGFSSATPSTAARMVQVDAGTGVVTDLGAVAANLRVQAADANPNDPSHPLYVVGRFGAGVVNQLLRFDSANPTSFAILANLTISGIDFTDPVESIVFDSRGRLIGASSANQILFDIDPSSGTLSAVRSTIGRPLHGIGVLNGQTALGDLALTADGEVLVYSNPAAGTVTRRHLATGSETTLAAGLEPSSLALIQLESNAHNTVDRALASTAPPALIYVSSRQSGEVAVFDLARNPAHPHYEFRQLPQDPDQAGPPWLGPISVSGSPSAVEFSPAGSVALVTSIQGNLCLIETAGGTVLQQVSIGHKGVSGVHFSADGQRVYLVDSGAGVLHVLR